jgi:hypothetical protein
MLFGGKAALTRWQVDASALVEPPLDRASSGVDVTPLKN